MSVSQLALICTIQSSVHWTTGRPSGHIVQSI